MTYDSDRKVTLLYGGTGPFGALTDTWEWDGETWTQVASDGPPPLLLASMVYDSRRHVAVLFGGYYFGPTNEIWEWDGASWTQRQTDPAPKPRQEHAMAYDSARGVTVLFGGEGTLNKVYGDTWEYTCAEPCYPDLDGNGILDLFDFLAFVNAFNAGDVGPSDCDHSGGLDLFDFLCFTNAFNAGC